MTDAPQEPVPTEEQTHEPGFWPDPQPEPAEEPAESLDDDGTPGTGTETPEDELVEDDSEPEEATEEAE